MKFNGITTKYFVIENGGYLVNKTLQIGKRTYFSTAQIDKEDLNEERINSTDFSWIDLPETKTNWGLTTKDPGLMGDEEFYKERNILTANSINELIVLKNKRIDSYVDKVFSDFDMENNVKIPKDMILWLSKIVETYADDWETGTEINHHVIKRMKDMFDL